MTSLSPGPGALRSIWAYGLQDGSFGLLPLSPTDGPGAVEPLSATNHPGPVTSLCWLHGLSSSSDTKPHEVVAETIESKGIETSEAGEKENAGKSDKFQKGRAKKSGSEKKKII